MTDMDDLKTDEQKTEAFCLAVDVVKKLADEVELAKELAAQDRIQIARLIVLIQRLLEATDRLEQTTVHVAEDLAASVVRADEAPASTPGAGADAALRSGGETSAETATHDS